MSKPKFKHVAPASAPKPQAAPPEPDITKHEMIAKIYTGQKRAAEKAIAEFKDEAAKSISYALVWKAESALFSEIFLFETRGWEEFITQKLDTELADLARLQEGFERTLTENINALAGGDYQSDEGPWMARSTSAMANIELALKANVKRRLVSLCTAMLRCIDE